MKALIPPFAALVNGKDSQRSGRKGWAPAQGGATQNRRALGTPAAALHDSCNVESVIGRKNKVGKKCPGRLQFAH